MRKKIVNFCKKNNFNIRHLNYVRGGFGSSSYWELEICTKNGIEQYDSNIPNDVDGMFSEILEDNH